LQESFEDHCKTLTILVKQQIIKITTKPLVLTPKQVEVSYLWTIVIRTIFSSLNELSLPFFRVCINGSSIRALSAKSKNNLHSNMFCMTSSSFSFEFVLHMRKVSQACQLSLLFWTENSPENTASAHPSPYHSGKGYTHSKVFHNSKKSGKAGTSFGIQQRAEKSAKTKRSTKSILHGLPDSDSSDSEFVGTPSSRSRSHTLNTNQKSFQNGSIGLTTPSSGLTERERVRTKSQSMVISFC
jgi:hypothetical protein